jgi:hypothetical protein
MRNLKNVVKAKKERLEGAASGRMGMLSPSGPASKFNVIDSINDPTELITMGLRKSQK